MTSLIMLVESIVIMDLFPSNLDAAISQIK